MAHTLNRFTGFTGFGGNLFGKTHYAFLSAIPEEAKVFNLEGISLLNEHGYLGPGAIAGWAEQDGGIIASGCLDSTHC